MLTEAIANRSVIAFEYEDSTRVVEPHCLGRGAKQQLLLRAWQTGGESDTINIGWKLFTVEKMQNIRIAPPRPKYNAEDGAMRGGIIAALQPEIVS